MSLKSKITEVKAELAQQLGLDNLDGIQFTVVKGETKGYAQLMSIETTTSSTIKSGMLTVVVAHSNTYELLNDWLLDTMELIANNFSRPKCLGGLSASLVDGVESEPLESTVNQAQKSQVDVFKCAISFSLNLQFS